VGVLVSFHTLRLRRLRRARELRRDRFRAAHIANLAKWDVVFLGDSAIDWVSVGQVLPRIAVGDHPLTSKSRAI
jgi:hypothetical protein